MGAGFVSDGISPLSDRVLRRSERRCHKRSREIDAAQRTRRHFFGVRLFGADYSGLFCLERGASAYRLSAKPGNVFGAYGERFLDKRGVLRTLPVQRGA